MLGQQTNELQDILRYIKKGSGTPKCTGVPKSVLRSNFFFFLWLAYFLQDAISVPRLFVCPSDNG